MLGDVTEVVLEIDLTNLSPLSGQPAFDCFDTAQRQNR